MAQPMLCTQCGSITSPRRVVPGSVWITLILLVCFVVPGLIYIIWRHTSTYSACFNCGSRNLMPTNTPFAQEIIATKPSVSASLAQEKQRQQDTQTGIIVTMVIVGVVFVIALLMKLFGG